MLRLIPLSGVAIIIAGLAFTGCSQETGDQLEVSGIIETTDVVISAKTAGSIERLYVREGDHVKAGDTLMVVDDKDLQLQKQQLLAGVDVASSQLELLKKGARSEDIAQAEEAVRQSELNLESATNDLDRFKELYTSGSIPEKTLDDGTTRRKLAERQLASARAALAKVKHGSRPEEISTGRARREQAVSQVASLDKRISDSYIIAPTNGIITARTVEEGELVNVGTNVFVITRQDPVKLKVYVPEDQLGRVKIGQPVELKIDTFNDRTFKGKVVYISPTAEFTPKNVQTKDDRVKLVFEVQIEASNPGGELKAGLTADADLTPSPSPN